MHVQYQIFHDALLSNGEFCHLIKRPHHITTNFCHTMYLSLIWNTSLLEVLVSLDLPLKKNLLMYLCWNWPGRGSTMPENAWASWWCFSKINQYNYGSGMPMSLSSCFHDILPYFCFHECSLILIWMANMDWTFKASFYISQSTCAGGKLPPASRLIKGKPSK